MRNADATRERILEVALKEFSSYGIAGARVDRIAKNAECSKNLIYIYFESKERLFTTVIEKNLMRVYKEFAFTPDDLPDYAARVFDFAMENPDLMRLMSWSSLEQVRYNPTEREYSHSKKIAELTEGQENGRLGTTFSPGFLLTAIMTLATAWTATNPFGPSLHPEAVDDPDALREAIAKAVRLLAQG
jgi:AcrR family transcriptional regulator